MVVDIEAREHRSTAAEAADQHTLYVYVIIYLGNTLAKSVVLLQWPIHLRPGKRLNKALTWQPKSNPHSRSYRIVPVPSDAVVLFT